MIERVHQVDSSTIEIFEAVAPWNHVRLVGEDVVATELLLPRSHRLRPYDLGALLAAGHTTVRVKARPIVGIIPTGDELIQPGEEAKPGAVIEAEGKDVGRVTSAVRSFALNRPIALGFVRREHLEPGTAVTVKDNDLTLTARITALPFYRRGSTRP